MSRILGQVTLVSLLVVASACWAEEKAEPTGPKWRIVIENDTFALDSWTHVNDDRNYTMGVLITAYGEERADGYLACALRFLDRSKDPCNKSGEKSDNDQDPIVEEEFYSTDFGVSAFTPNLLEEVNPIPDDRPYSCVTFYSKNRTRAYDESVGARRTKLTIGVIGLDICKAVQRYLHNDWHVSNQDPLGWDNQISEDVEPTAFYSSERLHLIRRAGEKVCTRYDLTTGYGYQAGYYTNAFAGLGLRVGRVCSPYYSFDANPNGAQAQAPAANVQIPRDNYGFLHYQARLVGYNALLQGQFKESVVTLTASNIERLVHEASAGWTYVLPWSASLTYAFHYHSTEIKGPYSRAHMYGGVVFAKMF